MILFLFSKYHFVEFYVQDKSLSIYLLNIVVLKKQSIFENYSKIYSESHLKKLKKILVKLYILISIEFI